MFSVLRRKSRSHCSAWKWLMSRILLLLLAASTCMCVANETLAKDRYALLVGVSKYMNSGMSSLRFPEKDASGLGEVLRTGGYEVETLIGENATRSAIHAKFDAIRKQTKNKGIMILGLFGHGSEVDKPGGDELAKEGAYCPYDTELRAAKDLQGRDLIGRDGKTIYEPDPKSLISLPEIFSKFQSPGAEHRILLIDCCHPNLNQDSSRLLGFGFKSDDLPMNTSVIFGSSPNEHAIEHPDWGHGAFTKGLLDNLPLLASQGKVTTELLAEKLREGVPKMVARVSSTETQSPRLFTTDSVDVQLTFPKQQSKVPMPDPPSVTKDEHPDLPAGTDAGDGREVTLPGGGKLKLIWCPPGAFTMGSPFALGDETPVEETVKNGFWLGQTEVTQRQWTDVMQTRPWEQRSELNLYKSGATFPAVYIKHGEAMSFCIKLTEIDRRSGKLPVGWKYALPTEVQWEYACRAGTRTEFSHEGDHSSLGEYAWFKKNSDDAGEKFAHAVATKKPNQWGLYDMHGNVTEWCEDWYVPRVLEDEKERQYYPRVRRVIRGGSWAFVATSLRSAERGMCAPETSYFTTGFRLAMTQ